MHISFIEKLKRESFFTLILSLSLICSVVVIRYLIVPQIVLYKDNTRTLNNFQKLISSENGYSKIKEEIIAKNSQLHDRLSKVSNTGTD